MICCKFLTFIFEKEGHFNYAKEGFVTFHRRLQNLNGVEQLIPMVVMVILVKIFL